MVGVVVVRAGRYPVGIRFSVFLFVCATVVFCSAVAFCFVLDLVDSVAEFVW